MARRYLDLAANLEANRAANLGTNFAASPNHEHEGRPFVDSRLLRWR